MTLLDDLSDETVIDMAVLIHKDVCLSHYDEEDAEDADVLDHANCIDNDIDTVLKLLCLLDSNGVVIANPVRKN